MMKKVILFFITSILLYSCSNPEKDIKAYLEKSAPVLNSLEFMEVSDVDSVYDPYFDLNDIWLLSMGYREAVSKAMYEYDGESYKDRANFVTDSLKAMYDSITDCLITVEATMNLKALNNYYQAPMNSRGIKAKFRLNGQLRDDIFYYSGDRIIRSSIETYKLYKNVGNSLKEAEEDMSFYKKLDFE